MQPRFQSCILQPVASPGGGCIIRAGGCIDLSVRKRDSPRLVMSPSIGSVCLGCASLSFDGDQLLFRKLLLSLLRDVQAQHTMLQLCGNVFFRERLAHIEAPLQRSVITLLTYGLKLAFHTDKLLGRHCKDDHYPFHTISFVHCQASKSFFELKMDKLSQMNNTTNCGQCIDRFDDQ